MYLNLIFKLLHVSWEAGGEGKFFWSTRKQNIFGEGPNLDILWVFRDEIGSVRTRIVDLMTISVSKVFFNRVFEDFGLSEISAERRGGETFLIEKHQIFSE